MKKWKILAPLFILTTVLAGCGKPTSSNNNGVTKEDLNFKGITLDKKDYYKSSDFSGDGILTSIDLGGWLVVGDYNQFSCQFKDSPDQSFTVEFSDPSVCKYEKIEKDGQITHNLVALKTGGTDIRIYDYEHTMMYRDVVNARVAVRDPHTIFNKIAEADYWRGEFYSKAGGGDFRFLTHMGDEGEYNKFTLSMREAGHDYGTVKFTVDLETGKEQSFDIFHVYRFSCNVITQAELIPVTFDVSLALDTVYISAKDGIIDFFRPVYLS